MNDPYQSECRAVSALLVAVAAAELEPERAAQLQTHLAQCAVCQAELAAWQQTRELAAGLRLESPALDRYPEFLRRLATGEATRAQPGLVRLTEATDRLSNLAEAQAEQANAGLAAVVPLWGRRVLLRSGFGKGFELTVVSAQGRELLRVAATSLTRVAAVAAGFGLFAGLSVFGLVLLFTSVWKEQAQHRPQPIPELPGRRPVGHPARDWVRTFSHKSDTLALWPEGGQWRANWLSAGAQTLPLTLAFPRFEANRLPQPRPHIAGASDGHGALVVREEGMELLAWHISAEATQREDSALQPIRLAQHAVQPALAWFGDHYLLATIRPSLTAPHLELLPLKRDGQPLQERGWLAATTEQGGKVGWPSLVSTGTQGALFFFTEKGQIEGRTLALKQERVELGARSLITTLQRQERTPLQARPLADGYLLCWGEKIAERFELRLARVNARLQLETVVTVVATAAPVAEFDWRLAAGKLALAWLEDQTDGPQIFTQQFDVEGVALTPPQLVTAPIRRGSGLAFADEAGHNLVWTQRSDEGALRLEFVPLPAVGNSLLK